MPTTTGSNANYANIMGKIKSFLLNSSALWECVGDTDPTAPEYDSNEYNAGVSTATTARTIYFKCKGYDGQSDCYFALYNLNSGSSYYTIAVRGFGAYYKGVAHSNAIMKASNPMYMPMLAGDQNQRYWITGDERRIVIMTIADNTRPYMMGFGMFLQAGTPAEYPLPMFVGGSLCDYTKAAGTAITTDGAKSFFAPIKKGASTDPSTLECYTSDGWVRFANYDNSDTALVPTTITSGQGCTLPYIFPDVVSGMIDSRCFGSTDLALFPISLYIRRAAPSANDVLGEMDGMFFVSNAGSTLTLESTVTIDGVKYLLWSQPLSQPAAGYVAVRLEDY